jgi:hypothetical protein
MSNDAALQDIEKVIDIEANNAPIYMSNKDFAEKNSAGVKNEGISNSTVTNTIYQYGKHRDNEPPPNHLLAISLAIVGIVAIVGITIFALSRMSENGNQNVNVNSIQNAQVNTPPQNINTNNSNQNNAALDKDPKTVGSNTVDKPNENKVSAPKPKKTTAPQITKSEISRKQTNKTSKVNNGNYTPSPCSATAEGCPEK